ncbi:MAG: hypothetical protein LBC06_02855 [Rickettsiales bacterium]|nr:hypothetical protein [Rickettsiales bacterium]
MYGRNDDGGGNKWVPSKRFEWTGPDRYKNHTQQHESGKPDTRLGSSSATSASSSKGKDNSK